MSGHGEQHEQQKDPRRTFCKVCIGGLAVTTTAMVGFPVVAFLGRPRRLDSDRPVEVSLDQLTPGQAQYIEFRGQQIIVLMGEDGPKVFSASCPHLGCNVTWDTADANFHCPCHGAVFSAQGAVVSGPVSAPLKPVPFEIKDGKLIIA